MPRKHNKVSEPPEELENLISMVNLLPSNPEGFFKKIPEMQNLKIDESGTVICGSGEEIIGKKLTEYIFHREPETDWLERRNDLLKAQKLFGKFAELSATYMNLPKKERDNLRNNQEQQYMFFLHFLTINYKDREFRGLLGFRFPDMLIKPVKSDFFQLFEDFDIPFFRIRRCPICQNIFWARKLNSETCGIKDCVNKLSNQKRSEPESNKQRK